MPIRAVTVERRSVGNPGASPKKGKKGRGEKGVAMSLRINTNVASMAAAGYINKTERSLERSLKQLSSGTRFVAAGEDAAGYAISEQLRGQVSALKMSKTNTENAKSFIQVAEGGLNEQNNILIRLRELAVQAASDTYSDTERKFLDQEFTALRDEFDRVALTTKYGSTQLLVGDDKTYEFQVGPNKGVENIVKYKLDADTRGDTVGIADLSVSEKGYARDALQVLDKSVFKIADARAKFGAIQSRLQHVVDNNDIQIENVSNARSGMADTDVATAVAEMSKQQLMLNAQISVLAQANQINTHVMRLID